MLDRERCGAEFERSYVAARRVLTLTLIVLIGALLGYARPSHVDEPVTFTTSSGSSLAP